MRIRRITHCPVQGHGTRCEAARYMDGDHYRCTEERLALEFELTATGILTDHPGWRPAGTTEDGEPETPGELMPEALR